MNPNNRPSVVQCFSDEYIKRCRDLSPKDIVRFLEDYRYLVGMLPPASQRVERLVPPDGESVSEARCTKRVDTSVLGPKLSRSSE